MKVCLNDGKSYVFPFAKVNKGEKIILWGMGNVGEQYVEQIIQTKYCDILFAVDKQYNAITNKHVAVKAPEVIRQYMDIKVVIAQGIPQVVTYIKNELLSWGMKEENIISECPSYSTESENIDASWIVEAWKLLKIKKVQNGDLRRIGGKNDGGYIMLDDFSKKGEAKVAYSFGICDDVEWDKDMAALGYDVYMYDHTIEGLPEENEKFHWFKVGIADCETCIGSELNTLKHFLEVNGHAKTKHMILKMDVEGAEYGFLNMISEDILKQFDQIVFEFHGIIERKNADKLIAALTKLNKTHQVIHVHGNNYSSTLEINGYRFSRALEVTYVKRDMYEFIEDEDIVLPLSIDAPCRKDRAELNLGKWNAYEL